MGGIRDDIQKIGGEYYFDYIPDKRIKDSCGKFGSGALLGVFCASKGSSQLDQDCASVFDRWQVAPIEGRGESVRPSIQLSLL